MPTHSASEDARERAYVRGHPRLVYPRAKDVDGRDKPGHDAKCLQPAPASSARLSPIKRSNRLILQLVLRVRAVHEAAPLRIAHLKQFGGDEQMFGAERQVPDEEQSD